MSTKTNNTINKKYFMNLALSKAEKNLGNTNQNPSVGCVIVKNNCVISAGTTSIYGRPHAEINALNFSKKNLKNSDLYVTLEPCSHYGETPPCVSSIIKNKIGKVFYSIKDPDFRSHGKSNKLLKNNNIYVNEGILKKKVYDFYQSYFTYKTKLLPFVIAKIAISKDFFTESKKKKWITNSFSRARVHLMRSSSDCILTSINTVMKDNPLLTCRVNGLEKSSPVRFIIDKNLKISIRSKIVKTSKITKTIIFYNVGNKLKIKLLKKNKVKLVKTPLNEELNFDLKNILIKIRNMGFSRLFLEAGRNLTTNFLKENLVNVFYIFASNKKLYKDGDKSFKRDINLFLKSKKPINEKVNLFGDKFYTYKIK